MVGPTIMVSPTILNGRPDHYAYGRPDHYGRTTIDFLDFIINFENPWQPYLRPILGGLRGLQDLEMAFLGSK